LVFVRQETSRRRALGIFYVAPAACNIARQIFF